MALQKQSGFTLVELAIVLMIIGLLIGGVLRGQELMSNARMQHVIKQVTSYTGALSAFADGYTGLPGDNSLALARIPGCTAANDCRAGNGDGTVGAPTEPWTGGQQSSATENTQFWKHLALTHIISGVDPSFTGGSATWGLSHPRSEAGGGFSVITAGPGADCPAGASSPQCVPGSIILRLHGNPNDAQVEMTPVLSPQQASYIDRKMDNGIASTGDVVSQGLGAGVGCEGTYDETRQDKACVLIFALKR